MNNILHILKAPYYSQRTVRLLLTIRQHWRRKLSLHLPYDTGCIRPGDRLVSLAVLTPSHANVCRIREHHTIHRNTRITGNRQEMSPLGEIKVTPVNDGDLAPRQGIAAQTLAFPPIAQLVLVDSDILGWLPIRQHLGECALPASRNTNE